MLMPEAGQAILRRGELSLVTYVKAVAGTGPDGWLVTTRSGELLELEEEPVQHLPTIVWKELRAYI